MSSLPALIPVLGLVLGGMADILVLTKNQAMLVFKLAAIYGRDIDDQIAILKEIMPVIGSAFLWRTAARTAVGLAPAPIVGPPEDGHRLRRDVPGGPDGALLLRAGRPAAAGGAPLVPGRGAARATPASTTASSSGSPRGEALPPALSTAAGNDAEPAASARTVRPRIYFAGLRDRVYNGLAQRRGRNPWLAPQLNSPVKAAARHSRARTGAPCSRARTATRASGGSQQLDQLLDQWFYPRRWRADLHEPNPFYLLEKLWTANGQGETLYNGIAPAHANYDVFRHLVTRLVAQGVDEGWVELEFPDDPLDENPVYQLKFGDPDRFARGVERLFPEVDWDEQIEVPAAEG